MNLRMDIRKAIDLHKRDKYERAGKIYKRI